MCPCSTVACCLSCVTACLARSLPRARPLTLHKVYGYHGGRQQGHGHQVSAVTRACTTLVLFRVSTAVAADEGGGGGESVFEAARVASSARSTASVHWRKRPRCSIRCSAPRLSSSGRFCFGGNGRCRLLFHIILVETHWTLSSV